MCVYKYCEPKEGSSLGYGAPERGILPKKGTPSAALAAPASWHSHYLAIAMLLNFFFLKERMHSAEVDNISHTWP